ncbi:hypothetical protein FRC02_003813 [Tulasnella sp. 418]|nr:hypothetical protein FRC02_003813 [Tulasnella sp. 418]
MNERSSDLEQGNIGPQALEVKPKNVTTTSSLLPKSETIDTEKREEKQENTSKGGVDAEVVDWDGPDDPENPLNWSYRKKWIGEHNWLTFDIICSTKVQELPSLAASHS